MEIAYRLTEAEYLNAWRLRTRGGRSKAIRIIAFFVFFWAFILICLVLLWTIVQRNATVDTTKHESPKVVMIDPQAGASRSFTTLSLITNVGPFILLAAIWAFVFFRLVPIRIRRMYRKDPLMQGLFTVNLAPTLISIQNTAGFSAQYGLNLYEYWREGKGLIILVYYSGAYFTVSLTGFPEPQRVELRGILAAALPKK